MRHWARCDFGDVLWAPSRLHIFALDIERTLNSTYAHKASVVIEKDAHGFYVWCPELKGCQSQGTTLEEAIANISPIFR
jgi:hypothetical protein